MAQVNVRVDRRGYDRAEDMVRRFTNSCRKQKLFGEMRRRAHYVKACEKRRLKKLRAETKARKAAENEKSGFAFNVGWLG